MKTKGTTTTTRTAAHSKTEKNRQATSLVQGNGAGKRASKPRATGKKAEGGLHESVERYRALINQTTTGIAQSDLSGRLTFANPTFCEMLGYTEAELLGKTVWEITHPDDLEKTRCSFERLIAAGDSYQYEKRFLRQDGSILWANVSVSVIRDKAGKPKAGVAVVVDITGRKQMEQSLRKSEERLLATYEHAPTGIVECSPEGKYLSVNEEFCRITGYEKEDLLTYSIKDVTYEEDYIFDIKLHGRLVAGDIPFFKLEKRYVRKDGEIIWAEVTRSLVRDADGKPLYTVGTVLDVSERKRAELEIRNLSRLPAENPNPVMRLTPDGKVLYANNASAPLLEFWKRQVDQPIPDELHKRVAEAFSSGLKKEIEIEYEGKTFSCMLAPIREAGYVNFYGSDITERKRAEEALRASESLYRTIARSIPGGGVYVINKDFRYVIAEGPVAEAFGLSREILESHTVSEVFPTEAGERMKERLQRNFAGETVSYETRHNGRVYWTQQAPLLDSMGHAIVVTIDITERKQAEEALRESEERFRAIINQATAGIVRKDVDGRLMFVNQAFCEMLGYTESEVVGKTIWQLTYKDDIRENKRLFERLMTEGIPFKFEKRLVRRDGSILWVDVSVSPVMDAAGKPESAVAVEVDITGRKQAEQALQEFNLQLENRVQARTAELQIANQTLIEEINERKRAELALHESWESLQILSRRLVEVQEEERRAIARELHDRVGQTLAALNINLIIMGGQISEDSKQRLGSRLEDSMHLVAEAIALVRNVMTDLRPAVLDDYGLEAALQSYIDEYKSRYGIEVLLDPPERNIPRFDPGLEMTLLRIAQEALTNVARHAQAKQVNVSLELKDHAMYLTVQDNGVGMEGLQEKNHPGSRGLKIMRERAEAFGGSVNVQSTPGKGTKVEARIPIEGDS